MSYSPVIEAENLQLCYAGGVRVKRWPGTLTVSVPLFKIAPLVSKRRLPRTRATLQLISPVTPKPREAEKMWKRGPKLV
jgi:hypothetical protein